MVIETGSVASAYPHWVQSSLCSITIAMPFWHGYKAGRHFRANAPFISSPPHACALEPSWENKIINLSPWMYIAFGYVLVCEGFHANIFIPLAGAQQSLFHVWRTLWRSRLGPSLILLMFFLGALSTCNARDLQRRAGHNRSLLDSALESSLREIARQCWLS